MCDVKIFLTFTSPNMVLLWQIFYLFCSCILVGFMVLNATFSNISVISWQSVKKGNNKITELRTFGALKSDSTHHFFRNACTKSGSLRFSQYSGCWLILSVYMVMREFYILNEILIFKYQNILIFISKLESK
jgi:hypothetical protein